MKRDKIFLICQERCCDHFAITMNDCHEAAFFDEWAFDELDRIEMAIFIENAFDIDFSDEEIDYREMTFGGLITIIERKVHEAQIPFFE